MSKIDMFRLLMWECSISLSWHIQIMTRDTTHARAWPTVD